jgi:hypothetical protein
MLFHVHYLGLSLSLGLDLRLRLGRGYWDWCNSVRGSCSSPKRMSQHAKSRRLIWRMAWNFSTYTVTGDGVAAYAVVVL